jgi:holo-[acyl-carrier protein] synthase
MSEGAASSALSPTRVTALLDGLVHKVAPRLEVGVDAVHIPTWDSYVRRVGRPLLQATYCPDEIAYAAGRIDRLATRLAAKEAVLKLLGTGIRGAGLRDVEILTDDYGRPSVALHGAAAEIAESVGIGEVAVSLSHEADLALAVAVAHRGGDA